MFLPHDNAYAQARAKAIIEEILEQRELFQFGWREVPLNVLVLGEKAQLTMPRIEQVLIGRPAGMNDDEYERRLFLARNEIEKRVQLDKIRNFYITSFSHRVIVYKGLLTGASLEKFYRDLANPGVRNRHLPLSRKIQHEYISDLASQPAVPGPRTQRRNQHHPGQP